MNASTTPFSRRRGGKAPRVEIAHRLHVRRIGVATAVGSAPGLDALPLIRPSPPADVVCRVVSARFATARRCDQLQFARASQPPQRRFALQRAGAVRLTLLVDERDRATAPRVLRGGAYLVRFESPPEIDGDARIERAIAAAQNVN